MVSQILKKCGLALLILFIFSMPNTSVAEDTQKERLVTVEGNAMVRVKPQLVRVTLELYAEENTPGKAYDKIVKESHRLIQTLNQLGLRNEDFKNDFTLGEVTYPKKTGQFRAKNALKITLRDFSLIGYLVDLVTEEKVSDVDFWFQIANQDSIYLEALKKAMDNAKNKAKVLAERWDLKLGELVSIKEGGYRGQYRDRLGGFGRVSGGMNVTSRDEGTYITINPEEIEIDANVTAVFRLEKSTTPD